MPVNRFFLKLFLIILSISFFLYIASCEKSNNAFEPLPPVAPKDTLTISMESVSYRNISIHINKKLKRKGDTYLLNRILSRR